MKPHVKVMIPADDTMLNRIIFYQFWISDGPFSYQHHGNCSALPLQEK
jgi:hypothetical protein